MNDGIDVVRIAEFQVELMALGSATATVYGPDDHPSTAVTFGRWSRRDVVPVRLQSSCMFGEVLGSADCDCRTQLEEAFRVFEKRGCGVLIYLDQEGRGAGLAVKARAYELQQRFGLDTVDAYRRLGIEPDQRRYEQAAAILKNLKVRRVLLLTNNPRKVDQLRSSGIKLVREQHNGALTRHNEAYLRVKQEKLDHLLGL